ncbi:MAG: hypothetical protein ACTSVZ_02305 [Promethearchaeota archaeon]
MNFIDIMGDPVIQSRKIIAIGITDDMEMNARIYEVCQRIIENSNLGFVYWGQSSYITLMRNIFSPVSHKIEFLSLSESADEILSLFWSESSFSTDDGAKIPKIDAIIRGGISSSKFLKALHFHTRKSQLSQSEDTISDHPPLYRLALLETADHHQFFYAGVGIDEINSFEAKKTMIQLSIDFFKRLGRKPKIGILSGGRLSDIGRDAQVDRTISQANKLEEHFIALDSTLDIQHYQILIEDAIKAKANIIVAPDGISGNLIYRTLIHLGNGKSYGAVYLNNLNQNHRVIIDCSRVAPRFEIKGAIYLAAALSET